MWMKMELRFLLIKGKSQLYLVRKQLFKIGPFLWHGVGIDDPDMLESKSINYQQETARG